MAIHAAVIVFSMLCINSADWLFDGYVDEDGAFLVCSPHKTPSLAYAEYKKWIMIFLQTRFCRARVERPRELVRLVVAELAARKYW